MEPTDDQRRKPFPPEYAHLEEGLLKREADLSSLDQELNEKRHAPRRDYKPEGSPVTNHHQRTKAEIQKDIADTKAQAYQDVERATAQDDPKVGWQVKSIAFDRLYSRDIAAMREAERLSADPARLWTMDGAELDAIHVVKRHYEEQRVNQEQVDREEGRLPARTMDEMTDRFLALLNTNVPQGDNLRGPEPNQPEPEPEP